MIGIVSAGAVALARARSAAIERRASAGRGVLPAATRPWSALVLADRRFRLRGQGDRIASAKAPAEGKRSSGRFAIARRTTASNDGGAVTESCDGAGGSVFSALCMIADMPPSNGRSPVSI